MAVLGLDRFVEACRHSCLPTLFPPGRNAHLGSEQGDEQFDKGPSCRRAICRTAAGSARLWASRCGAMLSDLEVAVWQLAVIKVAQLRAG